MQQTKQLTLKDLSPRETILVITPAVLFMLAGMTLFGVIGATVGGGIGGLIAGLIMSLLNKRRRKLLYNKK